MSLKDVVNSTDSDSTKAKLASLKAQLLADTNNFDPQQYIANPSDFPASQQIKSIEYVKIKKVEYKEKATRVITNIILNYVKDPRLLESPRLADVKEQHIDKLAEFYLLVGISENNVILVQESIDGGDMSKEQFMTVNAAQFEMRANINGRDQHIEKCEKYWGNYSDIYGLENQEEKIILDSSDKIDPGKKTIITSQTEINNAIADRMAAIKKENEEKEKS